MRGKEKSTFKKQGSGQNWKKKGYLRIKLNSGWKKQKKLSDKNWRRENFKPRIKTLML